MCGRYERRSSKQKIAERMRAKKITDAPIAPDYNIAPTTFQPVVRSARDSAESEERVRELLLMRWGFVPPFIKSLAEFKGISTINARAESVATSPTYRDAFKRHRCLVPADGFYEWRLNPDGTKKSAKGAKQPFHIGLQSGEPMAFAGLWSAWKEPKQSPQAVDTWLLSYTIITTEANELMAPIHTRMPVILAERDWARWLDPGDTERPPLDLLRPFDAALMIAAPCNPAVGNVRNNGPEMLVCPAPPQPGLPLNSA